MPLLPDGTISPVMTDTTERYTSRIVIEASYSGDAESAAIVHSMLIALVSGGMGQIDTVFNEFSENVSFSLAYAHSPQKETPAAAPEGESRTGGSSLGAG